MARILVIDDDPQVLSMLVETLQREGYEVDGAADGRVALQALREEPADLVITDIVMPEMEGIEVIQELRRSFPQVKVIAISGGGRGDPQTYLQLAGKLGAQSWFVKPVDRRELLKTVGALLGEGVTV